RSSRLGSLRPCMPGVSRHGHARANTQGRFFQQSPSRSDTTVRKRGAHMTTTSKNGTPPPAVRDPERSQLRAPFRGLRFEGTGNAPPEAVYDLLADLSSHLEWAGARQRETTRLLTMDSAPGPATVGT